MERKEVLSILTLLKTAYPYFYSKMSKQEAESVVNLWQDMFVDESAAIVAIAVKELISIHTDYPPNIGHVKEQIRNVIDAVTGEPTEHELWNIYKNTVSHCLYRECEAYNSLPPILQKYAGSPGCLRDHAVMEAETFNSVIRGQFLKQVARLKEREKYTERLPAGVKETVLKLVGKWDMPEEPHYLSLCEENDRRNEILTAVENYGKESV